MCIRVCVRQGEAWKGCYPIGKPAVGPSSIFTEGLVIGDFAGGFLGSVLGSECCWYVKYNL